MSSDLVFIIGRQRSGTTVVRELLAKHGAFNADEIMHGDLSRPHRFYSFVREKVLADPSWIHPQRHPRLFDLYIDELRKAANGAKIALDLKYFGLNLIPAPGDLTAQTPYLLRYIRDRKAHLIHVVRRNKLRVHVSEAIAMATGKWSARRQEDLPQGREMVTLDPAEVLRKLELLEQEDRAAENLLSRFADRHHFVYETMFQPDGRFSPYVVRCVSRILGGPPVDPMPSNIRMNPEGFPGLVANWDALREALMPTRFAWMLDET